MPEVEIYFAKICSLCHKAMDFFRERGIEFEAHEVQWEGEDWVDSPNTQEMLRRCGKVDFVPQIFIDGRHISGWRTLKPMIDSGEIDVLLESSQK